MGMERSSLVKTLFFARLVAFGCSELGGLDVSLSDSFIISVLHPQVYLGRNYQIVYRN